MAEPAQRVLVLGATSLVGRFLTPRLVARGYEVVALSRQPQRRNGVIWLKGTAADPDLAERVGPVDLAFHLAPIWLLPDALPAMHRMRPRRLVAFSSTSRFTKEASPHAEEREVARRLREAEEALMASSLAWTILRPTLIYAEGRDQNVSRLARLIARFGLLPLAGRGEGLRQPVHADDLAAGALAAALSPAARNRAYDTPGGETLTYRVMAERVFEGLGRRPRILSVPAPLWRLGLAAAAPLLPGATAAMGSRMSEDLTFDPGPAARDFGWAPRRFRPQF